MCVGHGVEAFDGTPPVTWVDDCGTTCMLPDGHEGDHAWTRDDEIVFTIVTLATGGAA